MYNSMVIAPNLPVGCMSQCFEAGMNLCSLTTRPVRFCSSHNIRILAFLALAFLRARSH